MTKAAISILISSLILVTPILAVDSSTSSTPARFNKPNVKQDKIASREANLKSALQAFKDKQKAGVVQRINQLLNNINQNQTQLMQRHLEKMSAILDKLETRVNQKTNDIKNPQLAQTAIANSRVAIASAQAAVKTQTGKDYTISVTSESKVKTDVQTARQTLFGDLQSTRQLVIAAKKSVANAIRVAKSGIAQKEGTVSGQQ